MPIGHHMHGRLSLLVGWLSWYKVRFVESLWIRVHPHPLTWWPHSYALGPYVHGWPLSLTRWLSCSKVKSIDLAPTRAPTFLGWVALMPMPLVLIFIDAQVSWVGSFRRVNSSLLASRAHRLPRPLIGWHSCLCVLASHPWAPTSLGWVALLPTPLGPCVHGCLRLLTGWLSWDKIRSLDLLWTWTLLSLS